MEVKLVWDELGESIENSFLLVLLWHHPKPGFAQTYWWRVKCVLLGDTWLQLAVKGTRLRWSGPLIRMPPGHVKVEGGPGARL